MLPALPINAFSPGSGWLGQTIVTETATVYTRSMLPRLLGSLYRAFDKNPYLEVACRLSHADGFKWAVSGRTLIAGTEAGGSLGVYPLEALELYTDLIGKGCTGIYLNPDFQGFKASVLTDGQSSESQSNGDVLWAYSSLLWAILDSQAYALEWADMDILDAIDQIDYTLADGEILDYWGQYWGIPRQSGETDGGYIVRTIDAILQPKVNAVAMEQAATLLAGSRIRIFEPWTETLYLDSSPIESHLCDGVLWNAALFRPYADVEVDWIAVKALLNRIKPAGVIMLEPSITHRMSYASFEDAIYPGVFGVLDGNRLDGKQQAGFKIS
jgi:hypothetical protein